MIVRRETPEDRKAIAAVHTASFPSTDEAQLVEALRKAGRLCISLVAERQGTIVGHVAFSPVQLTGSDGGLGLAPVAVLPAQRRRGVAGRLIREGLALCGAEDRGFVVVLGDPDYYGRFGFVAATRWKLSDEYGGGDAFQALELRPGALAGHGGLVRYAPEFADLS